MSSATLPAVEGDAALAETELAWLVERRLLLTGGRLTPIEDNLNGRRHGLRDLHADQKTLPALRWSPDAAFVRQRELSAAGESRAGPHTLPVSSARTARRLSSPALAIYRSQSPTGAGREQTFLARLSPPGDYRATGIVAFSSARTVVVS